MNTEVSDVYNRQSEDLVEQVVLWDTGLGYLRKPLSLLSPPDLRLAHGEIDAIGAFLILN